MLLQIRNAIIIMTFKDLKKRIISSSSNQHQQQTQSFDKLQNKPFWIWDIEKHKMEDGGGAKEESFKRKTKDSTSSKWALLVALVTSWEIALILRRIPASSPFNLPEPKLLQFI
jgi:hypothetical protein